MTDDRITTGPEDWHAPILRESHRINTEDVRINRQVAVGHGVVADRVEHYQVSGDFGQAGNTEMRQIDIERWVAGWIDEIQFRKSELVVDPAFHTSAVDLAVNTCGDVERRAVLHRAEYGQAAGSKRRCWRAEHRGESGERRSNSDRWR